MINKTQKDGWYSLRKPYYNVMEEIVSTLVNILMSGSDYATFCKCEKCSTDITALALNTLPAHYVTSDETRKHVFEQLNQSKERHWINKRIISAIYIVGKYPHH
jgi:competence protein ComFB